MTADLAALDSLLTRTSRRVRVQRALDAGSLALAIAALAAAVMLALMPQARGSLPGASALVLLTMALAASRRVSRAQLADAVDRAGTLEGRVRAATEFMGAPATERSAFEQATLRDAATRARDVQPAQAMPLRLPRAGGLALLACALCALTALRAPEAPAGPPRRSQPAARVPVLDARDLAALQQNARALGGVSEPARQTSDRALLDYRDLLDRLQQRELDQQGALKRALMLEGQLARVARPEEVQARATLEALAGSLKAARSERTAASADGTLESASAALRKLAVQLRAAPSDPRTRELLQRALDAARTLLRQQTADEARARNLESLLKRNAASNEPSLLKRRAEQQRELAQLRREQAAREGRRLDKLSRQLARAGQSLDREQPQQAAQALDDAADALDEAAREQQDDARQQALSREVSQLRELLQQRALTEPPSAPERSAERRQRKPAPDAARSPVAPRTAGQSAARERRERYDRQARGESGARADAGTAVQVVAAASSGGATRGMVEVAGRHSVSAVQTVEHAGSEHDEQRLDAPTRAQAGYQDRALQGAHREGPSRSQVIRSAAQSGFASAPYRKVYTDYRAHAEAMLSRDEVPQGYRFHVRRYFELVRPREGQDPR